MSFTLHGPESGPETELGGKARALAALESQGLPVPPWFVVSARAFAASLSFAQQQALENCDVRGLATLIRGEVRLDTEAADSIRGALAQLSPNGEPVAVRSSASDEDGATHSFAGQFDSFLFVPGTLDAVSSRVVDVWRSAFSQRVLAYRHQAGLSAMPDPPAVLIQRMVSADRSGVAFGADPVSGRRSVAVVAAVWGLGTALVSGECDADTYRVDRQGKVLEREIAVKRTAHLPAAEQPDGVEAVSVPDEEARRPVLTDEQAGEIAELARKAGRLAGAPQDIEWALQEGRLYLLQSRPITALSGLPDPDGARTIWDNSNIAESYNGVTTPLTFSFARRAYTEVYRRLCATLGVSRAAIAENDDVFRHMLGLIRGRVYYNLLNWYRLLALLPGFTTNRSFMEQMMGVREALPEELTPRNKQAGPGARLMDRLRMVKALGGLTVAYLSLPRIVPRFHAQLDAALAEPDPPLEEMRIDELAALYRGMEQRLLTRWDPPLVNDLFAMIFYGVLGRMTTRWRGDSDGTLRNSLVRGHGGMISAEPALLVQEMANAVAEDAEMTALLRTGDACAIGRALTSRPALRARCQAYLDRFGDRCLEELKLESPTLHDDPTPLYRAIGRLAGARGRVERNPQGASAGAGAASSSVDGCRDAIPAPARPLFQWVLHNARVRIRDRENMRFERTRLFGRVRRIFVEIGRRLSADGLLGDPKDIFYLEVDEILGFLSGEATCTDLKGLAALRRREFADYAAAPPPADRFETRGAVPVGNSFLGDVAETRKRPAGSDPLILKGTGCCAGVVRARARVILDPRHADLPPGSILVAERTDPGWVMLFPAAAGILVERGSLLSHSAIVAREMGIPAIVSIPDLTRTIQDGEMLEMDGSTGIVRRLNTEAPPPAGGPRPEPRQQGIVQTKTVTPATAPDPAAPAPPTGELVTPAPPDASVEPTPPALSGDPAKAPSRPPAGESSAPSDTATALATPAPGGAPAKGPSPHPLAAEPVQPKVTSGVTATSASPPALPLETVQTAAPTGVPARTDDA